MSRAGESDADEPVVVGKYTQTRQRWLKEKIVKLVTASTIRRPLLCPEQGKNTKGKIEWKESRKAGKKEKIREKTKKQKKDNTVSMHQ